MSVVIIDPVLREMCVNVILNRINGDRFSMLLIESGINLVDVEWKTASRLICETDRMKYIAQSHLTFQ